MGIGNFFDNFMGGLAFGMLANNPFFYGMNCYGFGFSGINAQRVDFETFANPFPNPFANMNLTPSAQPISILNDFGNSAFPTFDFSQVGKTIWDNATNPDSEFNKRMKEYYENLNNNNNNYNNSQTTFRGYDMPFSGWYLPSQFQTGGFFGSYYPQSQFFGISSAKAQSDVKANKTDLEPDKTDAEQIKDKQVSYDTSALKAKWAKKKDLPDAFYDKVIRISRKIKCDPNDLMGVMWVETAKTFSPNAKNPHGTATGLIQFTSGTAQQLGTSIEKLKTMTAVEQLDYVEKFLVANKSAAGYKDNETLDRGTLYSLVFLPGRSKRDVLTSKGENYYEQNTVLDYNKDGKITKSDLNSVISENMA